MDLIKLSISLKLPRPWYSMLPEPSIRKPKSTTGLQTTATKGEKRESKGESENDSASYLCSLKSTQTSRMNQKSLRLFEMIVFAKRDEHRQRRKVKNIRRRFKNTLITTTLDTYLDQEVEAVGVLRRGKRGKRTFQTGVHGNQVLCLLH